MPIYVDRHRMLFQSALPRGERLVLKHSPRSKRFKSLPLRHKKPTLTLSLRAFIHINICFTPYSFYPLMHCINASILAADSASYFTYVSIYIKGKRDGCMTKIRLHGFYVTPPPVMTLQHMYDAEKHTIKMLSKYLCIFFINSILFGSPPRPWGRREAQSSHNVLPADIPN